MKRLIIAITALVTVSTCFAVNKYLIFSGTNSIMVNQKRFPLNTLILVPSPDSVRCQFLTVSAFGNSYGYTQASPMDSVTHYFYNGVQVPNYRAMDSIYQAKFVK